MKFETALSKINYPKSMGLPPKWEGKHIMQTDAGYFFINYTDMALTATVFKPRWKGVEPHWVESSEFLSDYGVDGVSIIVNDGWRLYHNGSLPDDIGASYTAITRSGGIVSGITPYLSDNEDVTASILIFDPNLNVEMFKKMNKLQQDNQGSPVYKHYKNGKLYHLDRTIKGESDGELMACYSEIFNQENAYVRPLSEFRDKFQPIFMSVEIEKVKADLYSCKTDEDFSHRAYQFLLLLGIEL